MTRGLVGHKDLFVAELRVPETRDSALYRLLPGYPYLRFGYISNTRGENNPIYGPASVFPCSVFLIGTSLVTELRNETRICVFGQVQPIAQAGMPGFCGEFALRLISGIPSYKCLATPSPR